MAFGTYEGDRILDSWAADTVMSLNTGDPSGTGTLNEATGTGYSRQAVTFGAASAKAHASSGDVSFVDLNAQSITHYAQFDGSANARMVSALASSITVQLGQTVTFSAGNITNTLT